MAKKNYENISQEFLVRDTNIYTTVDAFTGAFSIHELETAFKAIKVG